MIWLSYFTILFASVFITLAIICITIIFNVVLDRNIEILENFMFISLGTTMIIGCIAIIDGICFGFGIPLGP